MTEWPSGGVELEDINMRHRKAPIQCLCGSVSDFVARLFTKHSMKRFAIVVLAFAAVAFAQDDVKQWAEMYETDVDTVQMCLNEAKTTEAEINAFKEQMQKMKEEDFNEETKKSLEKYSSFIACLLEKKEMLKDSKLVVEKIMEALEKDKDKFPVDNDIVKECLTSLNNDSEITREDRAIGMTFCIFVSNEEKNKKK